MQVLESGIGELLQPYSMEEFREWNRAKSRAFVDKRMSEQEANSLGDLGRRLDRTHVQADVDINGIQ